MRVALAVALLAVTTACVSSDTYRRLAPADAAPQAAAAPEKT